MSFFDDIGKNVYNFGKSAAASALDFVGARQIASNIRSPNYDWMGNYYGPNQTSAASAPSTRQPSGPDYGDLQKQLADSAAQLRALQYQMAQQPKIHNYDIAGANARARAAAESAVNPYYSKKLNDFLAQEEVKKQRANENFNVQTRDIEQALQDALQTSEIGRTRTTEDTASKLGEIGAQENFFQETEGTQFDRARSALLNQTAQSGLLGSGLGAQQDANAISDRNVKSAEQTRGFDTQRQATELFKTRTFEDLARSDTLSQRGATQNKEKVKIDLDRQLQDIGFETEQFKYSNEAERLNALLQEESRQNKLGVANFIAGLQGKGVNSRDLAATAQFYGSLFG